jgi:hypothetical protein
MWSFLTAPVQTTRKHYAKKNIESMDWDVSMKITGLQRKASELSANIDLINSPVNKKQSPAQKNARTAAIYQELLVVRKQITALQKSKESLGSVIGAFDRVDVQKSMVNCMGVLNTEMTNNKELSSVMSQFRTNISNMGLSLETMDNELRDTATKDTAHLHQEQMTEEEQKQMMEEFGLDYGEKKKEDSISTPTPTEKKEERKEIHKEERPATPDSGTRTLQQRLEKLQVTPVPPHVKEYA